MSLSWRGQVRFCTVWLAACAVATAGCGASSSGSSVAAAGDGQLVAPTLEVAVTTHATAFLAQRIGGPQVLVRNMTEKAIRPYGLRLSAQDRAVLFDSDLVFYLGEDFQPEVTQAAQAASGLAVDLAEAARLVQFDRNVLAVDPDDAEPVVAAGEAPDPHFWLDPRRMMDVAAEMTEAFAEVDPERAQEYQLRGAELREELAELDAELTRGLASCDHKVLVTSHPGFGYLSDRFGLEPVMMYGMLPHFVPKDAVVQKLADYVAARDVPAFFFESVPLGWVSLAVSEGAEVETFVLDPMQGTTQQSATTDYLAIMSANLENLRRGLQCT